MKNVLGKLFPSIVIQMILKIRCIHIIFFLIMVMPG